MIKYSELIGICIPVYNNLKYLKINLELLYNLFEENNIQPLKIFISDNCSDDGLKESIDCLKDKYPSIIYNRNDSNLGLDGNVESVLKMADTRFAWLLGVDDSIKGDIKHIFDLLKKNDPDLLILSECKTLIEREYSDSKEIFLKLAYEPNWISGDIFKKEFISKLNFKKYSGTFWGHTGAILDYNQSNSLKIIVNHNKNVYRLNGNNFSWNDNFIKIMCFNWADMIMSYEKYSYREKLEVLRFGKTRGGRMNNIWLLSLRAQNKIDLRFLLENYDYLSLYNNSPKIILMFISVFPASVLKIIRNLYIKVSKKNNYEI